MHGQVAGRQPAVRCLPRRVARSRQGDLQHGAVGGVEHGGVVGTACGEGCCVDDDGRTPSGDQCVDHLRCRGILQAGEGNGGGIQSLRSKPKHECAHRGEVVGEQAGSIEDHQCGAERALRRRGPLRNIDHAPVGGHEDRRPERHRCRRLEGLATHERRGQPERIADVAGAALAKVCVEKRSLLRRHGGQCAQARVGPIIAGQCDELGTGAAACLRHLLKAVAPIVEPAEAADDDEAAFRYNIVDVEIDGHRVTQPLGGLLAAVLPHLPDRRQAAGRPTDVEAAQMTLPSLPSPSAASPTRCPTGCTCSTCARTSSGEHGHIDGALHIPLRDLPGRVSTCPRARRSWCARSAAGRRRR